MSIFNTDRPPQVAEVKSGLLPSRTHIKSRQSAYRTIEFRLCDHRRPQTLTLMAKVANEVSLYQFIQTMQVQEDALKITLILRLFSENS